MTKWQAYDPTVDTKLKLEKPPKDAPETTPMGSARVATPRSVSALDCVQMYEDAKVEPMYTYTPTGEFVPCKKEGADICYAGTARFIKDPDDNFVPYIVKVGLVTTVVNSHDFDDWLRYHLLLKFDKILVFSDPATDDPDDIQRTIRNVTSAGTARGLGWKGRVEFIPPAHALCWKVLQTYTMSALGPGALDTLANRKLLNNELSCRIAKMKGLDWLLFLDTDELFAYPDDIHRHFYHLESSGYTMTGYMTREAIYTRSNPENRTFQNTHYFKESLFTIPPASNEVVKEWIDAHGVFNAGRSPYKCAIRVISRYPGCPDPGSTFRFGWLCTVDSDEGESHMHKFPCEAFFMDLPTVLHYPTPTLDSFFNKYYSRANILQCRSENQPMQPCHVTNLLVRELFLLRKIHVTPEGLNVENELPFGQAFWRMMLFESEDVLRSEGARLSGIVAGPQISLIPSKVLNGEHTIKPFKHFEYSGTDLFEGQHLKIVGPNHYHLSGVGGEHGIFIYNHSIQDAQWQIRRITDEHHDRVAQWSEYNRQFREKYMQVIGDIIDTMPASMREIHSTYMNFLYESMVLCNTEEPDEATTDGSSSPLSATHSLPVL
mmetsp:Transcript_116375/g.202360  ORF Transcript_116375/g.202360 Transcript_116375/m.202360 type:complete len:603 (-) Transcript_116375:158-1966(-)